MNISSKIKTLTAIRLFLLCVFSSVIMSCIISGGMSLFFYGVVKYDYIITGFIASLFIATIIIYIILSLTKEINSGNNALQKKNHELTIAISELKQLKGLLPICSHCKKIRDDNGYWNQIESYIQQHSEAEFSHGMCPDCSDNLYSDQDWYIEMKKEQ